MRLLHVVPTYWPAFRYGGPIHSVHALCRSLVDRGHEVEVFTTNVDGTGELDVPVGDPVDVDGVRVTYFPCPAMRRRIYRAPWMLDALRERTGQFDLVHGHSVFLWPTLAASRAAARAGVPWVLSPRGMLVRELIDARGRLRKGMWIRVFERRSVQGAAFVHATSEVEAHEIRRLGLEPRHIAVIPNGVELPDEEHVHPPAERGDLPLVLYLGRLSWKKNLNALVRAVAAAPSAQLVLAGPDEENLAEPLEKLAVALGARERVRWIGPVQGVEKRAWLQAADLLALPSHSENFGNVVLEALAHGTPVICTRSVGAAQVVDNARAGYLVHADAPSITAAIERFLALPAGEREALKERAHACAQPFAWTEVARKVEDAYRSALGRELTRAA